MATTIKHLKVGGTTYDIGATSMGEANLTWGGKNYSGSYGPIDAAMISNLGANRFAFANASGITIEYSRDGGSTWTDYGATDSQKLALTTVTSSFTVGKRTSAGSNTISDQLRITFDTKACNVYSVLNKFCIYLSTNGSTGCTCTIDAAKNSDTTKFTTFSTASLSGWSGYNIINTTGITTYGNDSSQYQKLRFTFKITGVNSSYSGLTINSIFAFGGVGWSTPSSLAKTGHMYSYDENKNVTFPANVTATKFSGSGASLTSLNASNVSSGTLSADRLATSGVTAGSYGPTANVTGTNNTTITVPQITVDNKGRVTSVVNRTYTSKDTSYSLPTATSSELGGVKIGNNISVSSGTISLTKDNVTAALGYTPPTTNSTYVIATASTAGLVKPVSVITKPTINSVTTTSGKYYSVQMSSDGAMFVNVPWSSSHYTAYNYVGAADAASNAATTNGNTYLKLYESGAKRSQFKISGSGGTTVTSDASGNITISSSTSSNSYHTSGSWSGLTYTATANGGAGALAFTIPTGTTSTTVATGDHTHSQYLTSQDITGKANLSGATFTGAVTINAGVNLKFNKIQAPTSSGGSTYGNGSSGQVLKSNGTTVYWAADNNSDSDSKTSSSNTTSKIYLVGPTSQSSSGQTTYSNSSCYASGGYLYSNGVKVDMSSVGVEWGTF